MDPNGYGASSTYTVGRIWKNVGIVEKGDMLTKSSRVWLNVFLGRPSQCIYRMILGFLTHGILLCMVFIYGFWPILTFTIFLSFLERVGINHNKCSTSLHLWGRNNNVLDHIWWIFSCEGKNGGNNGGNMMHYYGLDHGDLSEIF